MYHPAPVTRMLPLLRRPGFGVLTLAALSVSLYAWLALSVLVPFAIDDRVEWVFVSASLADVIAVFVPAWLILAWLHRVVRGAACRRRAAQPVLLSVADVSYVSPLLLLPISALALLVVFLPDVSTRLTPWLYLLVDLRAFWGVGIAIWIVRRVNRRAEDALVAALTPVMRGWLPDVVLVATAAIWVAAGTPHLRFSAVLHGDEPKYIRFAEAWYQGLGVEISDLRPVASLPPDFQPRVGQNLRWVVAVLPGELRALASDAATLLANPSHRFNRATSAGLWFITGKDGGLYQTHTPGLAVLLFPAYLLDRHGVWPSAGVTPREGAPPPDLEAHWPADLFWVHACLLGLYLLLTVALYRLLIRLVNHRPAAWAAAAGVMLSLPVAAFPFQIYPETAAALIVVLVTRHLLAPRNLSPLAGATCGLLAGFLPWLHVRFSAVAAVLALAAVVHLRRDRRRLLAFVAASALPVVLLCLYAYRLTGSVLPTAMYAVETEPMLHWSSLWQNTIGYVFDRDWGIVANAPLYLLALPGFWWLSRRRRDAAWLIVLLVLALLLPSAAHSLLMGVTTPLRAIVAVLPLLAVPMADLLARRARGAIVPATFGVLGAFSLQTAWAYNRHHVKWVGPLSDTSVSGWSPAVLLPADARWAWDVSWMNGALLLAWVTALVALLIAPPILDRMEPRTSRLSAAGWPVSALALLSLVGILGTVTASATGSWTHPAYRVQTDDAALRAARQLDRIGHCAICLTSSAGAIGTNELMADLEARSPVVATRRWYRAPTYAEWLVMPDLLREWHRQVYGFDPPGSFIGHHMYRWRAEQLPAEEVRRLIFVEAGLPAPTGPVDYGPAR